MHHYPNVQEQCRLMRARLNVRRAVFDALFIVLVALTSIGLLTEQTQADEQIMAATIPPSGVTIPQDAAGVNFIHLAPFSSDTTVSLTISNTDSVLTYQNLEIGGSTGGYISRPPGTTRFTLALPGGTIPALVQDEELAANTLYTFAAIGGARSWPLELLRLIDSTSAPPPLRGQVRVAHVAPFGAPPASNTRVNVVDAAGATIDSSFLALEYRNVTPYVTLPVGQVDWQVTLASGDVVLDVPPLDLNAGAQYTLFILGDNLEQPLASLLLIHVAGQPVSLQYLPLVARTDPVE